MPLNTSAERSADESRGLPGFGNLSLPGIKEEVGEMLRLIGRDGIFSTYTLHDVTHIDQMLQMLDWLIPRSTREFMSPTDWLLTVLAIYFHDLGMVTTTAEFEARTDNSEFVAWRNGIQTTTDGQEYLARMNRMSPEEKERFLFQEYIRRGHPQRIKEWVTGHHSRNWGSQVEAIASRVSGLLRDAPVRFRDSLAAVCESHHRDDLERTDRYPLVARFGNSPGEVANVQYAAILLRATDLLHVTKDRTPSVMYETVKFSDPKSVEEWDKQLGAFAVGPKGRQLEEGKPESAVVVSADFSEERPLFSLQEYVAYADSQIRQCARWAEKSQESSDARAYRFPWHRVEGDVRLEGVPPQPMRFELDRGQLLDLLVGHTIYNEPTVAVRELLQNGIDAVRYQAYLDARTASLPNTSPAGMGRVLARWDPTTRFLTIEDDGVGMDRDVINNHLMSVGSSYYNTPQFEAEHQDFAPISRFGIGILTCFMVSDDIEIVTCKESRGYRIRMTSVKSTYLLRELDAGNPLLEGLEPHGTRVRLRLRDTVDVMQQSVLDIIRHWVILPECVVLYQEPGQAPVSVGFSSLSEALRSYETTDVLLEEIDARKPEIILKRREKAAAAGQKSESYELALAVRSSYFPEKSFEISHSPTVPSVCIEGIRVSEFLPGFERSRQKISALLSVRGSRRFRTTVSRAGPEMDEEYGRVAGTCLDMLFEHVGNEVNRISSKAGQPLSQAATACAYLIRQLERSAKPGILASRLDRLIYSQPSIVVERVDEASHPPRTSRQLLSPSDLSGLEHFWTIESRSVDSLGIISRDLGRELSLYEFLSALAPDVTQLRYSPLLPDAAWCIEEVRAAHHPQRAEYSREHRQTAVRWELKKGRQDINLDFFKIATPDLVRSVSQWEPAEGYGLDYPYHYRRERFPSSVYVESARFIGDDDRVTAVSSRMGLLLNEGSELLDVWLLVRGAALQAVQARDVSGLTCAFQMAGAFESTVRHLRSGRGEERHHTWRDTVQEFREVLTRLGLKGDPPGDLRELLPRGTVFDATSLWRDQERRSEEGV